MQCSRKRDGEQIFYLVPVCGFTAAPTAINAKNRRLEEAKNGFGTPILQFGENRAVE
jgi:hypothetical protein